MGLSTHGRRLMNNTLKVPMGKVRKGRVMEVRLPDYSFHFAKTLKISNIWNEPLLIVESNTGRNNEENKVTICSDGYSFDCVSVLDFLPISVDLFRRVYKPMGSDDELSQECFR